MTGRAYFVNRPSRLEDLRRRHRLSDRTRYAVVAVVRLPKIQYENFITDMVVTRDFLEASAPLCRVRGDGVLSCVLVRRRGRKDGVLVVPDWEGFVIRAAYVKDAEGVSE